MSRIHSLFFVALLLLPLVARADTADTPWPPLGLPEGLLNRDCTTASQPVPVVLIHGTFASTRRAFSSLAPALHAQGHCLFALNYGRLGTVSLNGVNDIAASLREVSAFVQRVLARTGARQVTLIGHSQGGLLAFLVARDEALKGRIAKLVAVAPSVRGTDRMSASLSVPHCPACAQQAADSAFMKGVLQERLNPPDVRTLVLATAQDQVVTPVARQFVQEAGVRNVLLQERFPAVRATHSGLLHVPEAIGLIRDFLAE